MMSQLVSCQSANGIVLATDSKAIHFDPSGKMIYMEVDRLVQLSQHTAILAGGAAEGAQICQTLKRFIAEEGLNEIQEVYGAALPFLAGEFEKFMRKECEILPIDPIHHIYFIIAGYSSTDPQRPFRLYLIWTKKKLPQLDGDEISFAYTAPRIMSLEYRLNRLCQENSPLNRILDEIKTTMEKLATSQEEVGPPFSFAFITQKGFQRVGDIS